MFTYRDRRFGVDARQTELAPSSGACESFRVGIQHSATVDGMTTGNHLKKEWQTLTERNTTGKGTANITWPQYVLQLLTMCSSCDVMLKIQTENQRWLLYKIIAILTGFFFSRIFWWLLSSRTCKQTARLEEKSKCVNAVYSECKTKYELCCGGPSTEMYSYLTTVLILVTALLNLN